MSVSRVKIPVMVTGVGGGGHGEQILKALRMASTGYEIVGGDMSPVSSGLAAVDHPYLLPPAGDDDYLPAVLAVCRKHKVRALFHGSEPELRIMSARRNDIREAGIFLPINPAEVIDICMDKARTMETLTGLGFSVPASRRVRCVEDALAFGHLPAVLKPSVGGGGSASTTIVQTAGELTCAATQMLTLFPEFLIQAYVGSVDQEYTVGVLTDMDGNFLNSIAVKRAILSSLSNSLKTRNRTADSSLGPVLAISSGVSQGEIGPFPEVTRPCEELAAALDARGPINIQCRFVHGKVVIFEINPRFSGTTSLRAMVGFNEPDTLVRRHILGEKIPERFPYRSGIIMRGLSETLVGDKSFPEARILL
jgi:carbamoyl-phosphate synthase large subunit